MKVVDGGAIIRVPNGWGVFCHKCHTQIAWDSECFQEDTEGYPLYHMWCRPKVAKVESAPEPRRARVPKRRMERVPA